MQFAGTYEFRRPVEFEGQKYEKVDFDLEKLGANDVLTLRREINRLRNYDAETIMTDDLLHCSIVARSCDLPAGFVLRMGAADYVAWAALGQAFFADALSGVIR